MSNLSDPSNEIIEGAPVNVGVSSNPVSAVTNAIGDVARMITKALPATEQQLAAFKMRSPIIYAGIMEHLYQRTKRHLRWHPREDIDTWVELDHGNIPQSARDEIKQLLHQDLNR